MYSHSRCCESLVARALTLWNMAWHLLAELTEDQRLSKLGRLNYQGAPDKVQTKWWEAYSFWSCVPFPFRAQVRRGKQCSFAAKKKKALQTVGGIGGSVTRAALTCISRELCGKPAGASALLLASFCKSSRVAAARLRLHFCQPGSLIVPTPGDLFLPTCNHYPEDRRITHVSSQIFLRLFAQNFYSVWAFKL